MDSYALILIEQYDPIYRRAKDLNALRNSLLRTAGCWWEPRSG